MIEAKELRIGNFLQIYDEAFQWGLDDFRSMEFEHSVGEYEPIPLTEEWLIKFGGVGVEMEGYPVYYINPFAIEFYEKECVVHVGRSVEIKINHVHQLQNLYFALTGEELKIKE